MTVLQALILGVVQGVAEFLPISSSGHLIVLQRVFGIQEPKMTFDIVAHIGSLTAVIFVFRRDIAALIKKPFQKMTGLLIVGTLPAVAAGFLLKDVIESTFRQGLPLAAAFALTGLMLWAADYIKPAGGVYKKENDITYLDALVVGGMQAVGIPPGVSRSGATIAGGLLRGLDRETAARFSFLLSIIAITGAGVLQAADIARDNTAVTAADAAPMLVGFFASALVGYLAIRLLLNLIKACRLRYFAYYTLTLAVCIAADTLFTRYFF